MPVNDGTMPSGGNGGNYPNVPQGDEYVTAPHVAILREHVMAGGSDGAPMYCGPEQLQQIANNGNKRVNTTGDATPLVLGHTEDSNEEVDQPEIVGYATNFSVGPLFDTGQQALFADFHVRKDEKDRVNKYFPRRSVEFWPKRMEIDPISLLGATTPEQDLGLVQFSRNTRMSEVVRIVQQNEDTSPMVVRYSRHGEVIRYSRSLESIYSAPVQFAAKMKTPKCECDDTSCPCCRGKCKRFAARVVHRLDVHDEEGTPMCEGCASDAKNSGIFRVGKRFTTEVEKDAREIPANHEPKRKSRRGNAMSGNVYPTPYRATPPHRAPSTNGAPRRYAAGDGMDAGDSPPDDATAQVVQAVLQSAPIQELVQSNKQMASQMSELMQMVQSQGGGDGPTPDDQDGDGQPDDQQPGVQGGGPSEEARWMHEPHEDTTAQASNGPPTQYEDDDEDMEQYAMGDDDCPTQYEIDDDDSGMDEQHQPRQYDAAFASSTNSYVPSETGKMNGHRNGPGKRRMSRTVAGDATPTRKSQWEQYVESLRGGDNRVRMAREQQEKEQMKAQLGELLMDKVKYARADQLRTLQLTEGIDMDVADEVVDTLHLDDAGFKKHVEKIKVRYKRDASVIQPIRLAGGTSPETGRGATPPEASMSHDEKIRYSRRLSEVMMEIKKDNPNIKDGDLMARARAAAQSA